MSIFTRYARWAHEHPEIVASQNPDEIIQQAMTQISGLSLEKMHEYAFERLFDVPKNGFIRVKAAKKPIIRLTKDEVIFINDDATIGVKKRHPTKHKNLKAFSMRGCVNRWKDACAKVSDGDDLDTICRNFILSEQVFPVSQQISEFDRFALTVQTECGNIADHDETEIDWITCTVTLGTQYGAETPAAISRFKKDIDHRVIESVRANSRIANCDLSNFYLKSTALWSGYHLLYTFCKKKKFCALSTAR